MKLCIDDADVKKIARLTEILPIDGVSTNPSILAKAGRPPYETLKEIRSIIGDRELFVQVISGDPEQMLWEAVRICRECGEDTLVKIPCTPAGYAAMKLLKKEKIRFIGTAIYSVMQGFLAAKSGAEYVAPYVNRIYNLGFDGVKTSKELHDAITRNQLDSGLLAASFKNASQVMDLISYGVKAVTVSPDVLEAMMGNAAVDDAVERFGADFASLCGPNKTMADL